MKAIHETTNPTGSADSMEKPQVISPTPPVRVTPPSRRTPNTAPISPTQIMPSSELHMVGIYEPQKRRNPDNSLEQDRVKVRVDRPGEYVSLVLSSHDSVVWDITATPGTIILRIAVGGYEAKRTSVFLDNSPYTPDILDLPTVYKKESENFHSYYKTVLSELRVKIASSFQGAYAAPAEGFVINSAPGVPTQEEEQSYLEFGSISPATLSHTLQQALDTSLNQVVFGKEGFRGSLLDGQNIHIPLPNDMPSVSWPVGAAYDPVKHRLWGATFGGEGILYAHDLRSSTWKAYSLNNMDVGGIIYDPTSDSLVATPGLLNRRFLRLDTQGNVQEDYGINIAAFAGLTRLYDSNNGPAPAMVPLAIDNGLLLVRIKPMFPAHSARHGSPTYVVDLHEGTAKFVR